MSSIYLKATGSDRGAQRQALLERAIEIGAEYAIFLDDDTVCPAATMQQLHYVLANTPNAAICGGIYCTKTPIPMPIVFQEIGGGPFYDWTLGDIFECKGLGTGCMMIRTSLVKDIPKPWFYEACEAPADEMVDLPGGKVNLAKRTGTDDLYFCQKVSDAGLKIMAHGGVLPVHMDQDGKYYTLPPDCHPCKSFDEKQAALKS